MNEYLEHTGRITLQLSNLCNFSERHAKCPAHYREEHQTLPSAIVYDVLDTSAGWGFGRAGSRDRIAWHIYSEPLIDPRLGEFVRHARQIMPGAAIIIWSNGWYLTPEIFDHFAHAKITWRITAYTEREKARIEKLRKNNPDAERSIQFIRVALDDRWTRTSGGGGRCHAPFRDLCIYPSGHIGLCCMDCRNEIVFADLRGTTFADAMEAARPEMKRTYDQLTRGTRTLAPCKRCRHGR